ncbi:unnamed protein product [Rhizophagus irregularis]|nr:unnamed protein product [Rhizophagus irregularis]CAB5386476.1 unnamed protein product [Rhizophagus irregularis]
MKWREQNSMKPEKIDDGLIKEEYEKSEKVTEKIGLGDNWLLLILSNRESTYTKDLPPPNCAIVDRDNFNDFYGKYIRHVLNFSQLKTKFLLIQQDFVNYELYIGWKRKLQILLLKIVIIIRENILMMLIYVNG